MGLYGTNFTGAYLTACEFYLVLGLGAVFDGTVLRDVKFHGGSFENASFQNADMRNVSFWADNMGGTVNLSGADLTGANLTDALFGKVIFDASTKFPDGFSTNRPGFERKVKA